MKTKSNKPAQGGYVVYIKRDCGIAHALPKVADGLCGLYHSREQANVAASHDRESLGVTWLAFSDWWNK